jgi:beta-phosphoglucomutase
MPLQAVLFDFDGTLADTTNVHITSWQRTLRRIGWDVDEATCARAMEVDDRVFLSEVFAKRKIQDGDVEGWVRRKQTLTVQLLNDSPRVYPGVAELIGRLQGLTRPPRLAVVTTTWRENVEVVLKAAGLRDAFAEIVGKEDVSELKPDPACYRLALERLGLVPGSAVAIEDSPTGLQAAGSAHLTAIAVGHRRPPGDWHEGFPFAATIAETWDELSRKHAQP